MIKIPSLTQESRMDIIKGDKIMLEEIKAKQIEDQKTFDNLAKGYHLYD